MISVPNIESGGEKDKCNIFRHSIDVDLGTVVLIIVPE